MFWGFVHAQRPGFSVQAPPRLRRAWAEFRLLAPTLTARKLWNALLITLSFYLARWTRKPLHWGMPVSLGIEPTTACNLRCSECLSGIRGFTRPTGRLSFERFQAIVDEVHPDLMYCLLFFQGEPYINPDFLRMAQYAVQKGLFVLSSTNAHFLDDQRARQTVESGLQRLIVSVDGADAETYRQYRTGGDWEEVLAGIRRLVYWKQQLGARTPFVDLQFIVFRHNEHELARIHQLGAELGVDRVSIKTAQVVNPDRLEELAPQQGRYSRYKRDANGQWRLNNRLLNFCWKLWQGAEITWDGRVLPCCFDKDGAYQMGQAPETPFRQIWKNDQYRLFRAHLLQSRSRIPMCTNCTEGTRVWAD